MFRSNGSNNDDVGGGVAIDFHLWATGVASSDRSLAIPHRLPSRVHRWAPLPQAYFNDYKIAGATIDQSMRGQDNWHLNDVGQGAFSFEARQAGGNLVIALSSWSTSDIDGFYIVLDDDNHKSYVMRIETLGNNALLQQRMDGSQATRQRTYTREKSPTYVNGTFRLKFDQPQSFWVIYQFGSIIVGQGKTPGDGPIILYMQQDAEKAKKLRRNGSELYYFGFARHGSRWKTPIHISNVTSFRHRSDNDVSELPVSGGGTSDLFPLPARPLQLSLI